MSLFAALFRRRPRPEVFDPEPETVSEMPARPYRVLHAGITFFSDPECRVPVPDAHLLILRCEDPVQQHHPIEWIPSRKNYRAGDMVQWDINSKQQWTESWFVHPESGNRERAWMRSVEFAGKVVRIAGA
jgi:hypothetical protein